MTDTYTKTPRRPLVPGPNTESLAQKAIALREAQREKTATELAPHPTVGQALQAGLGHAPSEIFSRNLQPTGKITRAIANVMKEVGTIQMTGYNSFHRYKYPKMEDILPVITPLMGENGLVIHQNEVEIKNIEGNRIAVAYLFTVYHESGESLPPARHTGMAIARDTKGNWDDKAVAKCHTNARKFHLQALFEIPLEVPDNEDANQRQERRPVPGPKGANVTEALAAGATVTVTGQGGAGGSVDPNPHKIVLGPGAGADQWANAYLKAIGNAKTVEELQAWDKANDSPLQAINDGFPQVYEMVASAFERRQDELAGKPTAAPDMPTDPQEAMNWIAEQLQKFKTYEVGEVFWNQYVAPREKDFDQVDWGMLLEEWQRFETRFPQQQDDVATVQGLDPR